MSNPADRVTNSEEEEEEEEEDEVPKFRRGSGFRMVTQKPPEVQQQEVTQNVHTELKSHQETISPAATERTITQEHHQIIQEQQKVDSEQGEVRRQQISASQQPTTQRQETAGTNNAQVREAEERKQAEIKEAQQRAQQEALQRVQQAQLEMQRQAQLNVMQRAQQEALQRAQQAQAQAQREAQMRQTQARPHDVAMKQAAEEDAQLKAKQEAETKARKEAELRSQQENEVRARKEAQLQAQREAQARAEKESQLKAQREAHARAQKEAQLQAQREAQARAEKESQLKAQREAHARAQKEAQLKAQRESQARSQKEKQVMRQRDEQNVIPQIQQKNQPVRSIGPVKKMPIKNIQPNLTNKKLQPQVPQKPAINPSNIGSRPNSQTVVSGPVPVIKREEIKILRGGEVQQNYLNNLEKNKEEIERVTVQPIAVQNDASWMTQARTVVSDIILPQPSKIIIPEFQNTVKVQPTVIVPKPTQKTRIDWREFPEEEVKEKAEVPRIKPQEWKPDKQVEIMESRSIRSNYQPGRIARVWPPPQDENQPPPVEFRPTKTALDDTWIHEEKNEMEKSGAWVKMKTNEILKEKIWPPPTLDMLSNNTIEGTGSRLPTVQWPPPEFEQQFHQDVEIIQTRLPVKPQQRQWPPPPPQYRTVSNEVIEAVQTEPIINAFSRQAAIPNQKPTVAPPVAKRAIRT